MASEYTKTEATRYNNEEIRIVMVGKTGAGKSATGNTILGQKCFKSKFSSISLTVDCAKTFGEVDGQKVAVIDTPGLFDTRIDGEKTVRDVSQSISYASPGPHIFLVVIKLGRYTEEEKQTVQKIQKIFGEEADKYSMVLFTHGDLLKGEPIEEFLEENKDLKELVAKCNGQYHVFNNDLKDRSQVSELLNKIRNIAKKNGGSHYTTEMFQRAEKVIEEEKQRILKEKEEQMLKEQEEVKKKIEEKYEQQIRQMKADREKERELMEAREREKEEEIKKMKEEKEKQMLKEKKERQKKYEQKMRQMKADRKKEKELMEAREREKEEEIKKMKEKMEHQARQEAENSNSVFQLIRTTTMEAVGAVVGGVVGGVVGAVEGVVKTVKSMF